MIIYRIDDLTIYETNSAYPDSDWAGKAEIILNENDPEQLRLAKKVEKYAPFVTFIYDEDGTLVEVEEDKVGRDAWMEQHPEPEEPDEPDSPDNDSIVTWDELAKAYMEGVNSIDE